MLFWLFAIDRALGREPGDRPNVVIIYADDLGYGDLACYGHPTIRAPHLDRMAREGARCTSFYSAAPVCTPSRAALLTGRLPIRNGMCSDDRRVLFPDSLGGIPAKEITIAEAVRARRYATACVGKWHLGHLPPYLPTRNGFDSYYGIPYSNDMDRVADRTRGREIFWKPKSEFWNVPLMRDQKVIERPANQTTITKRYTEQAVRFIREKKDQPFFLYLAHSMPHVPLFASKSFQGTSKRGLYGDVIEEIDWSVGQVLDAIRKSGIEKNTLVLFSSDNGPWLIFNQHGGSAGLLRDGKGSTFDGGMRVPGIFWWPGQIKAGRTITEPLSTLDMLPTVVRLSGGSVPKNLTLDGYDLSGFLTGSGDCPRDSMFFYRGQQLYAVRKGPYKAHFITRPAYGQGAAVKHEPPLLYHLEHDPSEKHNLAKDHPKIVEEIKKTAEAHRAGLKPVENQLDRRKE